MIIPLIEGALAIPSRRFKKVKFESGSKDEDHNKARTVLIIQHHISGLRNSDPIKMLG